MPNAFRLRLTFLELQQWARDGLRIIDSADRVDTPLTVKAADAMPANFSSLSVLVRLPHKYDGAVSRYRQVPALIDEVDGISLASSELTDEAHSRMQSLQVHWLPFEFERAWFSAAKPRRAQSPRPGGRSNSQPGAAPRTAAKPSGRRRKKGDISGDMPAQERLPVEAGAGKDRLTVTAVAPSAVRLDESAAK